MNKLDQLYDRITKLNKRVGERPIELRTIKLMEEGGEIAAELLKLKRYKHNKKGESDEKLLDNLFEETCDAFLVVLDIFNHYGFTIDEIIERSEIKCDKWEENINMIETKAKNSKS